MRLEENRPHLINFYLHSNTERSIFDPSNTELSNMERSVFDRENIKPHAPKAESVNPLAGPAGMLGG